METWAWIVLAVAVIIAAGLLILLLRQRRSTRLAERFGPEYDHAVREMGGTRRAQEELERREKRVEALDIRPLSGEQRERFAGSWRQVQQQFVDDPSEAVDQADVLVQEVMKVRGYPVGDFTQREADISVDHPYVVEHYRTAHGIAVRNDEGQASTEDLRQAMQHYRELFDDLLESDRSSITETEAR